MSAIAHAAAHNAAHELEHTDSILGAVLGATFGAVGVAVGVVCVPSAAAAVATVCPPAGSFLVHQTPGAVAGLGFGGVMLGVRLGKAIEDFFS